MVGLESAADPAEAAVVVGLVLAESLVLHVGYGAVLRRIGGAVTTALGEA